MVLMAHKLILFTFWKSLLGILCAQNRLYDIDKTPSCQLAINLVIKRIIKRWNWHVKLVINAGTVLVIELNTWRLDDYTMCWF
jgi:hypothetical protein